MPDTSDTSQEQPSLGLNTSLLAGDASRRQFLGRLFASAAAATALTAGPASVFAASGKLRYAGASIKLPVGSSAKR